MTKPRLYLIDATAFCYRAFFALKGLSTTYGQPTNAIYGFVNMLNKLIKDYNPEYLAVCFDVSRDTFRQKKFAEYKITRPAMPEGLVGQLPLIKEIIRAYNIKIFEKEGFEADDIIATLTHRLREHKLPVTIISSDKDIMQLIDKDICVFNPYQDKGKMYSENDVLKRYGVEPSKIADILALMGDSTDNIPGVPGVGEKTAIELIKKYDSLDNLINNLKEIKSDNLRKTITSNLDKVELSRELIQLNSQVELSFELADLKQVGPDVKKLYTLFKRLEFNKLLKELPAIPQTETRIKKCRELKNVEDLVKKLRKKCLSLFLDYQTQTVYLANLEDDSCYKAKIEEITPLLLEPQIKKIGYDLKRLVLFLKDAKLQFSGIYFDIMLAAYLVNPSRRDYSLESIAADHLDINLKETDPLLALDLITRLTPILDKKIKDRSLDKLFYQIEMPLVEVLADMEHCGVKIDGERLKLLSRDTESRLIELIENIYSLSGKQFNINSPKQLREVLFDKLKLPVIKKSKTGPSTNEEVLKKLTKHHKLPQLLLEYRQLSKLKSTYIDSLPQLINSKTGRIHTSFSQVATETGRLACSQPNLQNIPVKTPIGKKVRQAFTAKDRENLLVSADYSQIELRLLAHLSKDRALLDAFHKNKDIHRFTASLIYGIDEAGITDQMRELAKRINFSIIYGLSAFGLANDLEISLEEAQGFIDAYFARYPKAGQFIQDQINKAKKNGFVTTILGRRRYIPEIRNKNAAIRGFAERQAVNTPIQGSAADLIKLAMIDIFRVIKEKRLTIRMVLQIHDELLFEVNHKELDNDLVLIKEKMETVYPLEVPVKVDLASGSNWLEMEVIK